MTVGRDTQRDYNREHKDTAERLYRYDFDGVLRRYMMRSFAPFVPPAARALELGCYKGDFTELLAPAFPDLTVVEAADELIAATRGRVGGSVRYLHSTFEKVALAETFDAIFLVHTLEHLDDPVAVLARVRGWLSPGGRFFVAVPNANAPSRQIAVKMGLVEHNAAVTAAEREHGHRRTYSFDTLENEVRRAGLKIEARGGVFFKALANFQFDRLMGTDVMSEGYLEGCYQLGMQYPELCASIYLVCSSG